MFSNVAMQTNTAAQATMAETSRPVDSAQTGQKINADANSNSGDVQNLSLNEQMAKEQEKAMLEEAMNLGNKYLETMQTGLKFAYNTDISNLTVSLMNKANNEVIRQYPTKEMISMTKSFREAIQKMFADPAGILLGNTQA